MTVTECYDMLGGDYNKISSMLPSEALVKRFALKFLGDPSYNELEAALDKDDPEAGFRAAHNLKGVSGNLAFTKLYNSVCEITEMLRSGDIESAKVYFPNVTDDYMLTCSALSQLEQ